MLSLHSRFSLKEDATVPLTATPEVIAELAPNGVVRVGLNMANFLLVTGEDAFGNPVGVSPDIGRAIAAGLGVQAQFVLFPGPGAVADTANADEWDIANIAHEPQRANDITFSPAYCEIESTYLVPDGSPLQRIEDVDRAGVRIASMRRAAYTLWLEQNLQHAELVLADSIDGSFELFVSQKLDALAGLRPRLTDDLKQLDNARLFDGKFTAVQQAIGTPKRNTAGAAWLKAFVEQANEDGLPGRLITTHGAKGLSPAS
ncbi:MAG: transporter substrate-binding domain-containing protein [Rhodobacteraceae bacterium]|nr:transporter substrate-binding domain-containing protein [Paracoccaceae bacterium]